MSVPRNTQDAPVEGSRGPEKGPEFPEPTARSEGEREADEAAEAPEGTDANGDDGDGEEDEEA